MIIKHWDCFSRLCESSRRAFSFAELLLLIHDFLGVASRTAELILPQVDVLQTEYGALNY